MVGANTIAETEAFGWILRLSVLDSRFYLEHACADARVHPSPIRVVRMRISPESLTDLADALKDYLDDEAGKAQGGDNRFDSRTGL